MEPTDKYGLEARLEALQEKGCRHVWRHINALKWGEDLPELRDLSVEDRD